jgi:hypothetical protein
MDELDTLAQVAAMWLVVCRFFDVHDAPLLFASLGRRAVPHGRGHRAVRGLLRRRGAAPHGRRGRAATSALRRGRLFVDWGYKVETSTKHRFFLYPGVKKTNLAWLTIYARARQSPQRCTAVSWHTDAPCTLRPER